MTDAELKSLKVDKTIDARGSACPGPLLEAKKGIGSVPVSGIMMVISGDEGTTHDLPLWAAKVGHQCLGCVQEAGLWKVYVKRCK
jgi:tRNA 2-thiouridine synthesizing protein A